jgi:hypothetical protein
MGPAGAQTASFAEATSPLGHNAHGNGGGNGGAANGGKSGSGNADGTSANGSGSAGGTSSGSAGGGGLSIGNPVGALASLVTGGSDDGFGPVLPVLLIAILLGGLGFVALLRTRPQ